MSETAVVSGTAPTSAEDEAETFRRMAAGHVDGSFPRDAMDRLLLAHAGPRAALLNAYADGLLACCDRGVNAPQMDRVLRGLGWVMRRMPDVDAHTDATFRTFSRAFQLAGDLTETLMRHPEIEPGLREMLEGKRVLFEAIARYAEAEPFWIHRVVHFLAMDSGGAFTRFARPLDGRGDHFNGMAVCLAGLPPSERAALARRHPDLSHIAWGYSRSPTGVVLHAGGPPLGTGKPLAAIEDLPPDAPFDVEIWWWVGAGWPPRPERSPLLMAERIPGFARDMLRRGEGRLVISSAEEQCWHYPEFGPRLETLARDLGFAPDRIAFLAQNPVMAEDFAAAGTGGGVRVIAMNSHFLMPGMRTEPSLGTARSKAFLCLNNGPRPHRAALMVGLHRKGLLDRGHVSFNWGFRSPLPAGSRPLAPHELQPYFPDLTPAELSALFDEVEATLPRKLDLAGRSDVNAQGRGGHVFTFNTDMTGDSWFVVVTESEMGGAETRRFTEKTIKAIASCNPFIVFGNHGVLAALHDLGFETFGDVLDETYDTLLDPAERWRRGFAELVRIAEMPDAELAALYARLEPRLRRNRTLLLDAHRWFFRPLHDAWQPTAAETPAPASAG